MLNNVSIKLLFMCVVWISAGVTLNGCKEKKFKIICELEPCRNTIRRYANDECESGDAECEELKIQAKRFLFVEECTKENNSECNKVCNRIHCKDGINKRCEDWDEICERVKMNSK